jgi:hypothetical protein
LLHEGLFPLGLSGAVTIASKLLEHTSAGRC